MAINLESNCLFLCDAVTLLERLPDKAATLVYLDPPWGSRYAFGGDERRLSEESDFEAYLGKAMQQIHRILSTTGSLIVHWSQLSPVDFRLLLNQVFEKQPTY